MTELLCQVLGLYILVLFLRAVLSWFPIGADSPFATVQSVIYTVTEPVLAPVRGMIPAMGGFDISFIVVVFGFQILRGALC